MWYHLVMEKLVEIRNLTKKFPQGKDFIGKPKGFVYALNGINLDIFKGETLGIVGESGCGKSTLGRCILNLIEPDTGEVIFKNTNILRTDKKNLKLLRKNMQIVFQNPYSSLNPRMSIKDILSEPLKLNTDFSKKEIEKTVDEILECVGLSSNIKNNFPHEFSGGQRQRIVIAKALILKPEFIIADEPISALDISIQAQIISLLKDLKEKFNLTYMFISHDLRTVKHFCDRVAVMYLGEIVEQSSTDELFDNPLHPYTKALLNSIPKIDLENKTEIKGIEGEIQSNEKIYNCCNFCKRCEFVQDICKNEVPKEVLQNENHIVKCFLYK
ncbi:MAG: ATP-binding cassette domain-containing protein [Candidatus Gastranaerophilales bacterium]|nr:ATP-binding cassette domain-containing protein [Candidatus Gastranaerophilales bacterium]